jgi:hypothetical protein
MSNALNGWISDIESAATTGASVYATVTGKTVQPASSTATGTSPNPPTATATTPVLSSTTQTYLLWGGIALAAGVGLYFVLRH